MYTIFASIHVNYRLSLLRSSQVYAPFRSAWCVVTAYFQKSPGDGPFNNLRESLYGNRHSFFSASTLLVGISRTQRRSFKWTGAQWRHGSDRILSGEWLFQIAQAITTPAVKIKLKRNSFVYFLFKDSRVAFRALIKPSFCVDFCVQAWFPCYLSVLPVSMEINIKNKTF